MPKIEISPISIPRPPHPGGPQVPIFGESHPAARLSRAEVETIRKLYSIGVTCSVIADRFGVSVQTIRAIGARRSRGLG